MIFIPLYIVSDTRATINNRSSYMPHDQIFRGRSPPASSVYSEVNSNFTTTETGDLRTRSTIEKSVSCWPTRYTILLFGRRRGRT